MFLIPVNIDKQSLNPLRMFIKSFLADVLYLDDPELRLKYWELSLEGYGMGLASIYSLHFNKP